MVFKVCHQKYKQQQNRLDFIKINNFCSLKDIIKKVEGHRMGDSV